MSRLSSQTYPKALKLWIVYHIQLEVQNTAIQESLSSLVDAMFLKDAKKEASEKRSRQHPGIHDVSNSTKLRVANQRTEIHEEPRKSSTTSVSYCQFCCLLHWACSKRVLFCSNCWTTVPRTRTLRHWYPFVYFSPRFVLATFPSWLSA